MKRNFILLYLLLASSIWSQLAWGQSGALSWSIYQQVLNQSTVPSFTSPIFRNVGQTVHQIELILADVAVNSCTTTTVGSNSGLQFSYDGINFSPFGTKISIADRSFGSNLSTGISVVYTFVGTGAYPRVRFLVSSYDNVNCNITINYSGATTTPFTQVVGSNPTGIPSTIVDVKPVLTGGVGSRTIVEPIVACDFNVAGTVTSGTTVKVLSNILNSQQVKICSVVFSSPTTGGPITVQVLNALTAPTLCTTPGVLLIAALEQGIPLTLGSGTGSVLNPTQNQEVCISATGGDIYYSLNYAVLNLF